MPAWLSWLIGLAALIALAPLVATFARRYGRQVRRTSGLALLMLGFGHVLDPPSRHVIEAADREEEAEPAADPPR